MSPLIDNELDPRTAEHLESEVRWYCWRFPATFARAKGAVVWDEQGKEYIDFFSGCGVLNYGHNPEPLKRALLEYIANDGIVHSLDLRTTARHEFIRAFDELILRPRSLDYRIMFTGPTGTNAVEAALKLARKVTGRANVAAFTNGFHGMSLGSLAAAGSSTKRRSAGVPLHDVDRLPFDGYFGGDVDSIAQIDRLLDDPGSGLTPPAAFLVETVQGEGGLHAASAGWLQRLAALARKHRSLLIVDDIQTGCGRTGTFFSFEPAGLQPDLVCLSKALSGSGLPLSALLIRPTLDVWERGEHSGTFRGYNHAFVTARAALEYWRNPVFLKTLETNIDCLDRWITELIQQLPPTFRPRGRGLMQGVACPSCEIADRVCRDAYRSGIVLETSGPRGEVVKFMPPLNTEPELLMRALGRLRDIFMGVC